MSLIDAWIVGLFHKVFFGVEPSSFGVDPVLIFPVSGYIPMFLGFVFVLGKIGSPFSPKVNRSATVDRRFKLFVAFL